MRKFEFAKAYEEVEIAGKTYRIDFSDDKVEQYQKGFKEFYAEAQKLETLDLEHLTDEEQKHVIDNQKDLVKRFANQLLGEDAFEELYEKAGRSMLNMFDLLAYIADIMKEKTEQSRIEKKSKYVKKGRA
ncbi:hypothetical protein MUG87_01780 [Ectobacillus sp. JY-23]|uniref:hypothetical protein n=1 Tax=Ectobacillus sp. JY-23 TaxID=2933872 RepID=UPI001FF4994D|nr:hypothetical protein [Ectobacillus sp. JY-23]UOY92900.1 hypothetical protein MUG87_01780 [Ectobacillus sp. JY-23]